MAELIGKFLAPAVLPKLAEPTSASASTMVSERLAVSDEAT